MCSKVNNIIYYITFVLCLFRLFMMVFSPFLLIDIKLMIKFQTMFFFFIFLHDWGNDYFYSVQGDSYIIMKIMSFQQILLLRGFGKREYKAVVVAVNKRFFFPNTISNKKKNNLILIVVRRHYYNIM